MATKILEDSMHLFVESCQELGITKETMYDKLVEKYRMNQEEAQRALASYWKSE